MSKTITINNIKFICTNYEQLLKNINQSVETRSQLVITYINQNVFNYTLDNLSFRKMLEQFDIIHTDGTGMFNAIRFLFKLPEDAERVNGTDLYRMIVESFYESGKKIFYIGGIEQTRIVINSDKEKYCSAGIITNSGFKSNANVDRELRAVNPDVVFVGLGTPYQEEIALNLKRDTDIPVIICCGSGIDLLAGTYNRAPVLMRKMHLEWLHKLLFDFRRTWKRYVIGIPVFIFKILNYKITTHRKRN